MTPLKLLITLVRGELLRNTKKFAKMDTYVVARLGSTVFKTKICKCGGINPYWDDKFTTDLQDDDRELCLEVWEHDFGNHILLASGKVDASDVKSSTSQTLWVKVNSNESYAGQVLLHVRCETTDHVFENAENFVDPYIQKNIFQQRRSTNIIYLGEPAPSISIAKLLKEEQERQDKIFLEDKQSQRGRKTTTTSAPQQNKDVTNMNSKKIEHREKSKNKLSEQAGISESKSRALVRSQSQAAVVTSQAFNLGTINYQPNSNNLDHSKESGNSNEELLASINDILKSDYIPKSKRDVYNNEEIKHFGLPRLRQIQNTTRASAEYRSMSTTRNSISSLRADSVNQYGGVSEEVQTLSGRKSQRSLSTQKLAFQTLKPFLGQNPTSRSVAFMSSSKRELEGLKKQNTQLHLSQIGQIVIQQQNKL